MKSPIALKLTKITIRWFLILNLKVMFVIKGGSSGSTFEISEFLSGQSESELMASALVLEGIDASQGLCDGDVKDEMSETEEADWDPTMAALEARRRRQGQGQEKQSEEDEEDKEESVELLLLEIDGSFFLQGFLEVELDYGVQGLNCCISMIMVMAGFVGRHGCTHFCSLLQKQQERNEECEREMKEGAASVCKMKGKSKYISLNILST